MDAQGRRIGRPTDLVPHTDAQHGCFTDAQAEAAGFSRRARQRRLDDETWVRLGPGTLRWSTTPVTWRMRLRAGLLDLGPEALVGGRSAAALFGAEGFPEGPVEFLVPRAVRHRHAGGLVRATGSLSPLDTTTFDGFRVTSAARTVIDVAPHVPSAVLARLVDHVVSAGLCCPEFLGRRLTMLRGRGPAGAPMVDAVLGDAGGHSFLERRFLELVRCAGLPRPRCQVVHRRDGRLVARVDFDFDPLPVVVEVMGRRGHATEADRDRDAHRHAELAALGRIVMPFTSGQVFTAADWVLERLGQVLRRVA